MAVLLAFPIISLPLGLLLYSVFLLYRKSTTGRQARALLWLARIVWYLTIPLAIPYFILLIMAGGNPKFTPSSVLVFTQFMLSMISFFILPKYALSNIGKLYKSADYEKMILFALAPFVGFVLLFTFNMFIFF